ncbi:MAG: carboxypeptidase-like regulatory domain-containing protein, partial [Thermoplasmata archaeon]
MCRKKIHPRCSYTRKKCRTAKVSGWRKKGPLYYTPGHTSSSPVSMWKLPTHDPHIQKLSTPAVFIIALLINTLIIISLFVLPFFSGYAVAQTGGHTVSGYVRDINGVPVDGCRVYLESETGAIYETNTTSGGYYSIIGVPQGLFTLVAVKQGYYPNATYDFMMQQSDVSLDIVLHKLTTIIFTVRVQGGANDGEPVQNANIMLTDSIDNVYYAQEDGSQNPGIYRIQNMNPGSYNVTTEAPGFITKQVNITAVLDTDLSVLIELREGGRVAGYVLDEYGQPVENARVALSRAGSKFNLSDRNGYFEYSWGLDTGEYYFTISAKGFIISFPPSVNVTAGNTTYCNFTLRMSGILQGQVIDNATGSPVAGAVVSAEDTMGIYFSYNYSTSTGNYRLDTDLNGTYLLRIKADGYLTGFFESIVIAAGETKYLDFRLDRSAVVTGFIRDENNNPLRNATVVISNETGPLNAVETDAVGKYRFDSDILPGTYDIRVSHPYHLDAGAYDFNVSAGENWLNITMGPFLLIQSPITGQELDSPLAHVYGVCKPGAEIVASCNGTYESAAADMDDGTFSFYIEVPVGSGIINISAGYQGYYVNTSITVFFLPK